MNNELIDAINIIQKKYPERLEIFEKFKEESSFKALSIPKNPCISRSAYQVVY